LWAVVGPPQSALGKVIPGCGTRTVGFSTTIEKLAEKCLDLDSEGLHAEVQKLSVFWLNGSA